MQIFLTGNLVTAQINAAKEYLLHISFFWGFCAAYHGDQHVSYC